MNTRSSQRPNLNPTSFRWPVCSKPRRSCIRIESAVVGVDAGHHHVLAERAAALDQHLHQRRADALPRAAVGDVDRVLDGEAVAGPGAEVAEGGEAGDGAVVRAGDEQGIAVLLPGLVPGLALLERGRLSR